MLKLILYLLFYWSFSISLTRETIIVHTGFKEAYAYIGDNLHLECNLNLKYTDKGCNSSFLTFKKREPLKEYVHPNFTSVAREKVKIINSSLAVLILPNITKNDAGTYSCFVDSCIEEDREINTYKVSAQWDNQPYAVGDELHLRCKLNKLYLRKGCNASFLTFKKKEPEEEYVQPYFSSLPREKVSILNHSTAVLNITDITENDVGSYSCFVNSCVEKETEIKAFEVSAQYKPHSVTNFSCILVDWNEYLFCSWEHPVHYVEQSRDTMISLLYNADMDYSKNLKNCPTLKWNNCTWSEFRGSRYYQFKVIVTNYKMNHKAVKHFHIFTDIIDKPSAVDNIDFQESNKENCFNLSWSSYFKMPDIKKFQLLHQGPNEKEMKIIADNLTKRFSEVCDMKPYTLHKFAVICQAKTSGLKSDPKIINYNTPEKAPKLGPESINGSYTSGKCLNNSRDVTVFWKEVEREARNGIITSYIVKNRTVSILLVGFDHHQATIKLPCYSQEFIEIFASNSVGHSQIPTVLLVAPLDFKVPEKIESSFAVERMVESYLVHWDNYTDTALTFTVYWLEDVVHEASKQEIKWKIIPKHEHTINISEGSKLKFGLSVTNESSGLTSSIVWSECIYESKPDKYSLLAPDIEIITEVEESAIIHWTSMQCSKKYPYRVDQFILLCCEEYPCETNKAIKILTSASPYTISGLQAKTYWFALRIKVRDIEGPPSQWKSAVIHGKTRDLTNITTIIIILACVMVIVLAVIFSFIWRWCKAGHKRKKSLMIDENSDCPSTSYLLPEENSVNDDVGQTHQLIISSHNHPKSMQSTLKNLVILSQENHDSKNIITECLLPSSSFTDDPPLSALNSQITASIHVENLQPYCVIRNNELESEDRIMDANLSIKITEELENTENNDRNVSVMINSENNDRNVSVMINSENNDRNVFVMINSEILSMQSHCGENVTIDKEGFIVNHLTAYSKINLDHSSKTGRLLKSGIEKNDNAFLFKNFTGNINSENLTHCKEYVALKESNSLINSSLTHMEKSTNSAMSVGSTNYVQVNEQSSFVHQPSTNISVPMQNTNHAKNLSLNKNYVQINEQGSVVHSPSPDIVMSLGTNNHSQNLNLSKVYEKSSVVHSPSTDIDVPKNSMDHSQNINLIKDFVLVNEQGASVLQPSTDIPVLTCSTNHSQNLNVSKDYVQVNEQGIVVIQPSTANVVLTDSANNSKNLILNDDYVQVNEQGSVVHQPSTIIAVPMQHTNHVQNLILTNDYVQVNKQGSVVHSPSPDIVMSVGSNNHSQNSNLSKDYVQDSFVHSPSTDIPVPMNSTNHSQNINLIKDFVLVNEQGASVLQPSSDIPVLNCSTNHSQNLNVSKDYVQVNKQGIVVIQPSTTNVVLMDSANNSQNLILNNDYVQINEQGSVVHQPSTIIAVPMQHTNHSQNLNVSKDYVQVNKQGIVVIQPSTTNVVLMDSANNSQNLILNNDYV